MVTFTVETYEAFKDSDADFRWGIDKNNDQKVDNYISVEFDGTTRSTATSRTPTRTRSATPP